MNEEVRLLQEYIRALQNENSSKNKERQTLETQLASILDQNNKLRGRISTLPQKKQIEAYKKQIRSLRDTKSQAKDTRVEDNKENKTRFANTNELQYLLEEKQKMIVVLKNEVGNQEGFLKQQQQVREECERNLESVKEENNSLRQKLQFKNGIISELEKERNQLKGELDGLKAQTNKEMGKIEGYYQAQMNKLKQDNTKLMKSSSFKNLNSNPMEINRLKQQLANANQTNNILQSQLRSLEQQLRNEKRLKNRICKTQISNTKLGQASANKWDLLQNMINEVKEQHFALKPTPLY